MRTRTTCHAAPNNREGEKTTKPKSGKSAGLLAAVIVAMLGFAGLPASAAAQGAFSDERGTLPIRGTTYQIRVPTTWNGTLINDLDFAQTPDAPRYLYWLNHGYAVSGTARRADRATNYDPAHEIQDPVTV